MGEPKNPKLKKLLNKPVKNKLKKITPSQAKVLKTKAKTEERTLRKEARIKNAIEQQMKVPGYAQTKASKKAMGGRMIAREHKIPLSAPFKTVDDQRKVINTIRANVQIRGLNRTLLGTKKDTNYKTPPALSKKMAFKRKHVLLPDTRYPYTMGKTKEKTMKISASKILKEPNAKEFAHNVKSYVKQKESYEKKVRQEKAAGRLGTKVRQIIKGFNKPKRGK